jgi:membrane fusion protein, adhesin transport system
MMAQLYGSPMDLVRPARWSRVLASVITIAVAVVAFALYVTPWQQSAPGEGRLIAFAPDERQQNIEAPIEGRILRWYVSEGAIVRAGEPLVELSDNDPDVVQRLRSERDAVAARLDAGRARAIAMETRVDALESSRVSALMAADARVMMASQRVAGAEQGLAAADAALDTAVLNVDRQRGLRDKGLTSQRQLELTELESLRAKTEVERARATFVAAKSELSALESDKRKLANDATASINDALAARQSAEAEVANASAELSRIEVRLARQSAQIVVAPKDGVLFRVIANGHLGEVVKAGDLLATLVPDAKDRAVEIWVSGNDLPLIQPDNEARIQFEGWPALQFSGWPSIAVGTFPARVLLVDAADDGSGKFRVLLVPPEVGMWPAPTYLRQGARAQGWILLGQVRLGYELWRQFNSFPPSLPREPQMADPKSAPIARKVKGGV